MYLQCFTLQINEAKYKTASTIKFAWSLNKSGTLWFIFPTNIKAWICFKQSWTLAETKIWGESDLSIHSHKTSDGHRELFLGHKTPFLTWCITLARLDSPRPHNMKDMTESYDEKTNRWAGIWTFKRQANRKWALAEFLKCLQEDCSRVLWH